jgi:thiamine-monophosphate kinase
LAISSDMVVEGVHFRPGWLEPRELGWRMTAAALSDLAAVAAAPRGVLVSLALSPEWPDELVAELMAGVGDAADSVGAVVWGGDVVRGDKLTADVVVVGSVARPLLRSGAKVGDALFVTGRLGGPQAAIAAWEAGEQPEETARQRFAHPEPRVAEAAWLRQQGATALIDLSDGLLPDAGQLAAASGVQCVIDADGVPCHPAVTDPATALVSGEEYELLVTFPADVDNDLGVRFERQHGLELTRVGTIAAGDGVVLTRGGEPIDLPSGYRHF